MKLITKALNPDPLDVVLEYAKTRKKTHLNIPDPREGDLICERLQSQFGNEFPYGIGITVGAFNPNRDVLFDLDFTLNSVLNGQVISTVCNPIKQVLAPWDWEQLTDIKDKMSRPNNLHPALFDEPTITHGDVKFLLGLIDKLGATNRKDFFNDKN